MPGTAFRARHGWKESSAGMLGSMVHNFNSSPNFLRKPDRRGHVPSYLLTRQHFHMVNPRDCKFISMFFITKTEQTHHKPLRYQASKIDLLVAYVVRIGCVTFFRRGLL